MAKIPESVIETVRSATNITDVVGQYVQLKKSGKNLFGLCPFHEERTPSFSVAEDKQIFHCFSCGRGGNVFKFLMELESLSFPEAVLKVAAFSHVDIPAEYRDQATATPVNTEEAALIELHEQAAKLYHHVLMNTATGETALAYLHDRGMSDQTIETFNLGFAPPDRLLNPFFEQRQTDYQRLRQSGLFIEDQTGSLRDRFTNRIMFPLRNPRGQVIGFSGRVMTATADQPKYLNSPETPLFNKRQMIFNFDLARRPIRKAGRVVLFEGYMDVISAYQAGVENGIASMGTSLTNEQLYAIERITDQLDVCYDGDAPGQKATARALSLLADQSQLQVGVIQMPDGVDPDEFRRQRGDDSFKTLMLNGRETPVAFTLRYLKRDRSLATETERLTYLQEALPVIATVTSPMERDLYVTELATEFHLDKAALLAQLKQEQQQHRADQERQRPVHAAVAQHHDEIEQVARQTRPVTRLERAERGLLFRMLHDHSVWLKVTALPDFCFIHDDYQMIYTLAQGYFETHAQYASAQFTDFIRDDTLAQLVIELETLGFAEIGQPQEIDDFIAEIMERSPLEQQLQAKKAALAEASRLGDTVKQQELVIEIVKLEQTRQRRQQA